MNPEENNEVNTPDFSGEEMKMPENTSTQTGDESTSSGSAVNGPILVGLGVLLLLILGGMYYWFTVLNVKPTPAPPVDTTRPTAEENNEPESTTAEAQVETLETMSTSNEIEAIEADIESTDLESLDAELNAIDAELEAALQDI